MKVKNVKKTIKIVVFSITLFVINSSLFSEGSLSPRQEFIQFGNQELLKKNKNTDYYFALDFIESLAIQDRLSIYEKYPYLSGLDDEQLETHYEWYEMTRNFEGLEINFKQNYYISIGTPFSDPSIFYFSEYKKNKNIISFNIQSFNLSPCNIVQFDYYSDEGKEYTYDVDLIFDGDYVDFYLYGEFIHRFCKINEKTLKQLFSLFQENTVDLTKVKWPKHADGSCDYNTKDLLTKVKLNSIMYNLKDIPIYESPENNSSVICNLKKDSTVLIQRIGKKEKIDGLEDNWVQVEVQQESNGVTDEDFVIGEKGWCYGGFLEEVQ